MPPQVHHRKLLHYFQHRGQEGRSLAIEAVDRDGDQALERGHSGEPEHQATERRAGEHQGDQGGDPQRFGEGLEHRHRPHLATCFEDCGYDVMRAGEDAGQAERYCQHPEIRALVEPAGEPRQQRRAGEQQRTRPQAGACANCRYLAPRRTLPPSSSARLISWKGIDGVLDAIELLGDPCRLAIAGDGPERRRLADRIAGSPMLRPRVELLGAVGRDTVRRLMEASDLLVLNSTYEGLSHVLLEAMAAGFAGGRQRQPWQPGARHRRRQRGPLRLWQRGGVGAGDRATACRPVGARKLCRERPAAPVGMAGGARPSPSRRPAAAGRGGRRLSPALFSRTLHPPAEPANYLVIMGSVRPGIISARSPPTNDPSSIRDPRMPSTDYDATVIGGGPAGSTAATVLAQAGRRALLLERRETMPFKIGESLIPATYGILDRLGMLDELRQSHFPKKYSVQFFTGDGRASAPFYFHETDPSERSQTWQVLRSEFDTMMIDNAREHGVEVRQGAAVKEILFDGERAVGVAADLGGRDARPGAVRELGCRVVIDATGQRSLLARRHRLRQPDPCLQMAAIFTHFEGAQRDSGIDEGATLILQTEGNQGWFWFIPLPDDRASVGVVGPVSRLIQGRGGDPQRTFDEEVSRCPGLVPRLENARQAMEVRVLNDFSYTSEKMAGDGWILAGDAFGFLDPMYSSGVLLALRSGEMAGDATLAALEAGDPSEARLRTYEDELRAGMASFRQLIYAFYTPEFSFARFLRAHPEHRLAIVDILVGDVFDRDFSALFADIRRMLSLSGSPAEPAGMAAVGPAA